MAARKTSHKHGTKSAQPPPADERARRPDLPRSEPIRSWATLFGADSGAARAQAAYAASARSASSSVQRGVELGYRVIDEYLRQGTSAAEAFTRPGRPAALPYGDFSQMAERMLRSAQDFSSLWFDMMGTLMSNAPGQAAEAAHSAGGARAESWPREPAPRAENRAGAEPERWRVVARIDSTCPHELTVTLDDASDAILLQPLRAATGATELDASLELSEPPAKVARLHVRVPAGTPIDRYTGAVLDAVSGRPVGRVTIALLE
jgi:hypothetical protein